MSIPAASEGGPPGTELTGISFRDQLWLNTFPLERNLVFDYFALSPFYDRSCNNEQLRMRSIHPLDISHLSKMMGIEYMLYEVQEPNFFVFRKQKRDSAEKVTPTSAYYILDGSIYQAPNLHNVIGSRVVRALYHISKAFTEASTKLEKIGYDNEPEKPKAESKGSLDAKKSVEIFDQKEAFRVDQILGAIHRKLPPTPALPPLMLVDAAETVAPVASTQIDGPQPPAGQQASVDVSTISKQPKALATEHQAKRVKMERI